MLPPFRRLFAIPSPSQRLVGIFNFPFFHLLPPFTQSVVTLSVICLSASFGGKEITISSETRWKGLSFCFAQFLFIIRLRARDKWIVGGFIIIVCVKEQRCLRAPKAMGHSPHLYDIVCYWYLHTHTHTHTYVIMSPCQTRGWHHSCDIVPWMVVIIWETWRGSNPTWWLPSLSYYFWDLLKGIHTLATYVFVSTIPSETMPWC